MSINILALDQSSRVTGYAIFQDSKLLLYGHFTLSDEDIDNRLVQFRNTVIQLINDHKIDKVVYEDIQLQSNITNNVQTFKILAEIIGVLTETLTELNIPHESVLASVWKSNLKIKGKNRAEQKRNAQQYVIDTYNRKPTQDEADAICIGESYIYHNAPKIDFNWE